MGATTIEWTDYTLPEQTDVSESDSVDEKVVRCDAFGIHPFPYAAVSLGTVAGEARYKRLVTYTLPEEGGASLRAAGWRLIGEAGGGSWSRRDRPRVDTHPTQKKFRWEA